jgi:TolB-like protein
MKMKKTLTVLLLLGFLALFTTCTSSPPPPSGPTLDQTIQQAAVSIGVNLGSGIKIAMLNFTSASIAFSEYVLDELGGALVNTRKVSVVDRRELDLIRQEENFQLSGEVSDESMVSIGKKLGAQMIATGSLRKMGEEYRFTARVLNVETAQVEAFFSSDISVRDNRTSYLLSVKNPPPPPKPLPPATLIGTVQTEFIMRGTSWPSNARINSQAYISLLETAKKSYDGNIDVREIRWVVSHNEKIGSGYDYYNNYYFNASGKVVLLE